ncbi:MAG: hypothetical protein LBB86_04570 [Oscillospiraceae bacterium]|jgi:hypothetical protein|nr:hypothetical protein [Oscillospiraceae bacterium]
MRKLTVSLVASLILICGLAACSSAGFAFGYNYDYGTAFVNGRGSGKVYLREEPSAKSSSLGLFFADTEAACESTPYDGQWAAASIGVQTGWNVTGYVRSSSVALSSARVTSGTFALMPSYGLYNVAGGQIYRPLRE